MAVKDAIEELESRTDSRFAEIQSKLDSLKDKQSAVNEAIADLFLFSSSVVSRAFFVGGTYLFGAALAITISWSSNHSVPWAIVHGLFSWLYLAYYLLAASSYWPLVALAFSTNPTCSQLARKRLVAKRSSRLGIAASLLTMETADRDR